MKTSIIFPLMEPHLEKVRNSFHTWCMVYFKFISYFGCGCSKDDQHTKPSKLYQQDVSLSGCCEFCSIEASVGVKIRQSSSVSVCLMNCWCKRASSLFDCGGPTQKSDEHNWHVYEYKKKNAIKFKNTSTALKMSRCNVTYYIYI